ncbi:MAG TPA: nucleoside-triphosphatase [Spirochaetota bacterium]|nr:nucleoside-triphosphatase [Spirochaetota bacterium]
MINIICGKKDTGKTAKIKSIYMEERNGDGFITQKIFTGSTFCGYEIIRLSTGESVRQSLKSGLFPCHETPLYTRGPFSFFRDGFSFADRIIDDIILKEISPVFIDEIGPIELQGKGHHDCFEKLIKTDRTIYFTVRDWCLDQVISSFSLEKYNLIRL